MDFIDFKGIHFINKSSNLKNFTGLILLINPVNIKILQCIS